MLRPKPSRVQSVRVTRRRPLPPQFVGEPFAASSAVAAGVPLHRLGARDLLSPFHGVRAPANEASSIERSVRAYSKRMRPGNIFSHVTAAKLYHLPLPLYVDDDATIHVSAKAPARAPSGRNVTGHRMAEDLWAARDVIHLDPESGEIFASPCVTPELLWTQLATVLDRVDLIAIGDAMIGGGTPLCSVEGLARQVERWKGMPGAALAAKSLGQLRTGSLSRPESIIRVSFVDAGLPEPEINVPVHDRAGRVLAVADASWKRYRTLAEYEGALHFGSRRKMLNDLARHERYRDGGWYSFRATTDDVFGDPNPLIGRIARHLLAKGWTPSPDGLRRIGSARA